MSLPAGALSVTVEYAKDLKDRDLIFRQDPYCIIHVGAQTFRTRTARDGGRNPVWNETFQFNVINENDVEIEIKDDEIGRDEDLGFATITLAQARMAGSDRIEAPVIRRRTQRQHGFVSVSLRWSPMGMAPFNQAYNQAYNPYAQQQQQSQQPQQLQQPYYGAPAGAAMPAYMEFQQPPAEVFFPQQYPPHHHHHRHQQENVEVIVFENGGDRYW